MRRWGIVLTALYAAILMTLLAPGAMVLAGRAWDRETYQSMLQPGAWPLWVLMALAVAAQAILLAGAVDTSERRLHPRSSVRRTASAIGLAVGALIGAGGLSLQTAMDARPAHPELFDADWKLLMWLGGLWLIWGAIFAAYARRSPRPLELGLQWLLRGSVMELLVAVPCHIIVRRRDDCSAPITTAFGIATGIAVMLAAFGPGVLLLYHRRLADAGARRTGSEPPA